MPSIVEYDVPVETNIQVNNTHNSSFNLFILDPPRTQKMRDLGRFKDYIDSYDDHMSVRSFNGTYNMTGNWTLSVYNLNEGATFDITWTFHNPSVRTRQLWDAWNTDYGGCLYYPNNGSTCDLWDYRECWRPNLSVCNESCCRLIDHRSDKNITFYRRCYSADEYKKVYNRWPFDNKMGDLKYYVWFSTKFRDFNCQQPIGMGGG